MAGVGLGQLLLALDATMVSLVDAPRGLDQPVASAALIDSDDVRLGLAAAAGSADVFFLLGVGDDEALRWIDTQARDRVPVAVFVKEPSDALVGTAVAAGSAVVAVDPRARWERLYQLVNHVLEHHGDRADAADDSGTDLFGLAQSLAERIHGMVSIENAQSQVLAYSASNDEADELRRLSILGRAGPPEHLEWIGQWGIFDALRSGTQVVRVAERPELGLRPRLAVGIHQPDPDARRPPVFAGTIWVQQGAQPLADDGGPPVHPGAAAAAAARCDRLGNPCARGPHRDRRRARSGRGRLRGPDRLGGGRGCVPPHPPDRCDRAERQRFPARRPRRRSRLADLRAAAPAAEPVGQLVGARHHRRAGSRAFPRSPRRAPRWTACWTALSAIPFRSGR